MDIKKTPSNLFQHPAADCAPLNISHPQVQNELTPFSSSASPSKWYTLDAKDHSNTNYSKLMAMLLFTTTQYLPASSLSTMTTMSAASSESGFEFTQENALWIGRIFAWICTTLYLLSRIPQLLKNRRRQSVEGLAITLFLFAVLGNLTYSLSILTHPGQTAESLLEALPYLIGSAGTLVFDFSIFCQFLWYRKSNKDVEFV
jgi:uncharacterized protein with PQ loop repeat